MNNKIITISTILTALRIFAVPFIGVAMLTHHWGAAWVIFMLAALTDLFDGALARYLGEETSFGAYLDPVADKLLILSCYGVLAFVETPLFKIPVWFFAIFFIKEILLILGALYICLVRKVSGIKPTLLGKLTMVVQVCFIAWLFACAHFHWVPVKTFTMLLGVIVVLGTASFAQYIMIGIKGVYSWLLRTGC